MVEKRFNKLGMPDIERFENYLPTAFSSELTLLQKVNKIIQDLIRNFELTNEMVDYLNNFIETFDENLYETVDDILNEWLKNDKLAKFIRDLINEEVIESRTDYLGKKYVNLKERLDSEKADIVEATKQLAHKVGGGKLATMADLGQDVKEALTGGSVAVIGDNTVIESNIVDKQVTPRKTSFIDVFKSVNKFNPNTVVRGYITPSNGIIVDSESHVTTDFIEAKDLYLVASCTPSTGTLRMEMRFVAQFNENKEIIPYMNNDASVTNTNKVTLDRQTKYVRVSIRNDFQQLRPQLEVNNTGDFTEYHAYGDIIKIKKTLMEDSLNDIKITPEKTTFMERIHTHNRYNSRTNVFGFIAPSSGTVHSSETIQTTDFIEVTDKYLNASKVVNGTQISATMRFVAQFDANKKIIYFADSNKTVNNVQYVQLHPYTAFVRVSFTVSERSYPLQLEFTPDNVITSYVPYEPDGFKLLPEFLPSTTDETTSSPLTGKKVAWLGSSITQGYAWCELVNRFFNFEATNCGVGGTTVVYENKSSMCTKERLLGTYSNVTDPNTGQVTANGVAIPSDVEIIFWEGGTNDWARNCALGDTKEITYDEDGNIALDTSTFYGACHQALKNMTELFPNAVIIPIGTPFGKMKNRTSFKNKYGLLNNQNLQSVEYGDALIEVCGLWGFKGVNMGREMGVHDNNVATLVPDGLHLTTKEVQSRASKVIINHLLSLNLF